MGDAAFEETGDAAGNKLGKFSYMINEGKQELQYKAGPEGFMPIGGNMGKSIKMEAKDNMPQQREYPSVYNRNPDGSFNFFYLTESSAHGQISDSDGNVHGKYSYRNDAGIQDVTYEAGPEKGYIAAVKSYELKNERPASPPPQMKDAPIYPMMYELNPDGSYRYFYATDSSAHGQIRDAAGNVKGKYSYVDDAGLHDTEYVAGPEIGFVVVEGSPAAAAGLTLGDFKTKFQLPESPETPIVMRKSTEMNDEESNADKSYSFSYETDNQARSETSDAEGNVQGKYSYTDEAGKHEITYKAGPEIGFMTTGKSMESTFPQNFVTLLENAGDESSLFGNSNRAEFSTRMKLGESKMAADDASIKYDDGSVLTFIKGNPAMKQLNTGFTFKKSESE